MLKALKANFDAINIC